MHVLITNRKGNEPEIGNERMNCRWKVLKMYQNNPRMEIKASQVVVPNTPLPSVDKTHSNRAILLLGALCFLNLKTRQLEILYLYVSIIFY